MENFPLLLVVESLLELTLARRAHSVGLRNWFSQADTRSPLKEKNAVNVSVTRYRRFCTVSRLLCPKERCETKQCR